MSTLSVTYPNFVNGTAADADEIDQNFADIETFVNGSVVHVDGSKTMSAPLSLSGDPTADAHAVRKAYVDGAYVYATGNPSTAYTSSTNNVVKWSTEVTDTHAAFEPTTGIFTAPKTGIYLVSWTQAWDQSETALFRHRIVTTARTYNGPWYVPVAINNVNEVATNPWAMPVQMTANDTLYVAVNPTATVTRTLTGSTLAITWLHG